MQIKNRLRDKIRSARFMGPLLGACLGILIGHFLCRVIFDFGKSNAAPTGSAYGSGAYGGVEEDISQAPGGDLNVAKYYGLSADIDQDVWDKIKRDYETTNAKEKHQIFFRIGDATRELTFREFEDLVRSYVSIDSSTINKITEERAKRNKARRANAH